MKYKNEQTIANLKKLKSFHNGSYGADIDRAIKALEQEPFMNKPCVAHQVCHEDKIKTLDKIRAEINELDAYYDSDCYYSGNEDPMFKCDDVLQIIDKYRAESDG